MNIRLIMRKKTLDFQLLLSLHNKRTYKIKDHSNFRSVNINHAIVYW